MAKIYFYQFNKQALLILQTWYFCLILCSIYIILCFWITWLVNMMGGHRFFVNMSVALVINGLTQAWDLYSIRLAAPGDPSKSSCWGWCSVITRQQCGHKHRQCTCAIFILRSSISWASSCSSREVLQLHHHSADSEGNLSPSTVIDC